MCAVFSRTSQRKLSPLSHPKILMMQELGEFLRGTVVKAFCKEGLHFGDHRLGGLDGIVKYKNRPKLVGFPATGEVARVDLTIITELDVGVEETANECLITPHLEAGSFRAHFKSNNLAAAAAIIAYEEVVVPMLGQSGAGIVCKSRWPHAQVSRRWQEGSGPVFPLDVPPGLRHPRRLVPACNIDGVWPVTEALVATVPPRHRTFHHVHHPCLVAHVGVVINGEGDTVLVKCDLLRITKVVVDYFEIAAVRLHTENGTTILIVEVATVGCFEIVSTVSDGEIDAAIRAEGEAVEVVAAQTDTDAVAFLQRFPCVGNAVSIFVFEHPHVGNAGEVDFAIGRHDAGRGAIERSIETIGIEPRTLRFAVAVLVFQHPDFFGILGEVVRCLSFVGILLVEREAVGGGFQGDLVAQPVPVAAIVLYSAVEAVGFGNKQAVLLVHGNRGCVKHIRLTGEDPGHHVLGMRDGRKDCFVGSHDFHRVFAGGSLDLFRRRIGDCRKG